MADNPQTTFDLYERRVAIWKSLAIRLGIIAVVEAFCIIALALNNLVHL